MRKKEERKIRSNEKISRDIAIKVFLNTRSASQKVF